MVTKHREMKTKKKRIAEKLKWYISLKSILTLPMSNLDYATNPFQDITMSFSFSLKRKIELVYLKY